MKKALFFWFVLMLISSCSPKDSREKEQGKVNSVAVIIDDNLWLGTIGDSLRNKLATPVIGLDEEEPIYTLNQYPAKLLEGYQSDSHNIIVIRKEDKLQKTIFEIKSDDAKPQNIFTFSGPTTADILASLETNAPAMLERIRKLEISREQQAIRMQKGDDELIGKKFGLKLDFPATYKMVLKKRNFIWLKKEIVSGSSSVIVYTVPESQLAWGEDMQERIIHQRNYTLRKYVRGTKPHTPMKTENSFAPFSTRLLISGKPSYEVRGTWELANDFMRGPFICYCIYDAEKRRYIFLEGFCYAPSREKRDLIFELEAILKTVRFLK